MKSKVPHLRLVDDNTRAQYKTHLAALQADALALRLAAVEAGDDAAAANLWNIARKIGEARTK